jgi:DNA-binding transcriptional LysR family regulator
VQIELFDGNPEEHISAIRNLRLDVAFLTGPRDWPGCDGALMWSEGVFAVLPEDHELVARPAVEWIDLCGETFMVSEAAPGQAIYNHLVKNLAAFSWHPDIQVQSLSRDNLLSLVAIGQGLTLVNEAMTVTQFPGVVYRPILGERLPFSAVWSPQNDNPAFRRLLSLAKSMAATPTRQTLRNPAAPSQNRDPSP